MAINNPSKIIKVYKTVKPKYKGVKMVTPRKLHAVPAHSHTLVGIGPAQPSAQLHVGGAVQMDCSESKPVIEIFGKQARKDQALRHYTFMYLLGKQDLVGKLIDLGLDNFQAVTFVDEINQKSKIKQLLRCGLTTAVFAVHRVFKFLGNHPEITITYASVAIIGNILAPLIIAMEEKLSIASIYGSEVLGWTVFFIEMNAAIIVGTALLIGIVVGIVAGIYETVQWIKRRFKQFTEWV